MVRAIRFGEPHRATGELAYHVLEVMHAFHEASESGEYARVGSTFDRPPAPLPAQSVFGGAP
jgi:hypothetical protein